MIEDGRRKEILDMTCGGRMMWFSKQHPNAIYMDSTPRPKGCIALQKNFEVLPDVVADFRNLPFRDEEFNLVVWDPPHVMQEVRSPSIIHLKYGWLDPKTWREDLSDGFREAWRVTAKGGTLIFKWGEASVGVREVLNLFDVKPLFGHTTAKSGKTKWMCFYKEVIPEKEAERPARPIGSCDREDTIVEINILHSCMDVRSCERCGQDHDSVDFWKLGRPIQDLTHWGTCPTTGEPILMRFLS